MASISESYQQRGGASDEEAWAKELLAAMQANHEENEEECYGYPLVAEGAELKSMLPQLKARVQRLTPLGLSCIVCNLSLLMYQLRAWYTAGVGLLLVALLEKVAAQQNKLPSPPSKADPGMGALKLLEGVLLMCTALHAPVKVAELVEKMLRRRRLPPCVSARLEAAIVFLRDEEDMPGVPPTVKLTEDACETFLENLALSLVPQPEIVERVSQAKAAIQEAVQLVFSGSRLEFFGSSVNGFETQASDVDCVVLLSPEEIATLLEAADEEGVGASASAGPADADRGDGRRLKLAAARGAQVLESAVRGNPDLDKFQLRVVELITDARVPILKLESSEKVAIDVSFNNTMPLHNSKLLRSYANLDIKVQHLGRLVKWWAKKRCVNDAHEGTLSSYSHILLVIHYLQHVGMLPNLQDKRLLEPGAIANVGTVELVDGVHDVWFMDPECATCQPVIKRWVETAPENATLHGLLAGYFRYFAYEFPLHSQVASIRHPTGLVEKPKYFRDVAASKLAVRANDTSTVFSDYVLEVSVAEVLVETPVPEAEEDDPPDCDIKPDVSDGSSDRDDAAVAEAGDSVEPVRPQAEAEVEDGPRLPKPEHHLQQQLSNRQLFCIDDPMELGRTLGCTFQGGERIVYEMRRACELFKGKPSQREMDKLFSDNPPPAKTVWKLHDMRSFPSVLAAAEANNEVKKVEVSRQGVDMLLTRGGAYIKDLQRIPGIQRVHLDRYADGGSLEISGTPAAVQTCSTRVLNLVSDSIEHSRDDKGGKGKRSKGKSWQGQSSHDTGYHDDPDYYRGGSKGGKGKSAPEQSSHAIGQQDDLDYHRGDGKGGKGKSERQEPRRDAHVSYYGNGRSGGLDGGDSGGATDWDGKGSASGKSGGKWDAYPVGSTRVWTSNADLGGKSSKSSKGGGSEGSWKGETSRSWQ
mmetsp:Transcript_168185/g.540304  ORF Transcript_168185/g.540304 Transcript_168185/m.540304 type:complete len:923 (+) Transcript_168185:63-2831(+)